MALLAVAAAAAIGVGGYLLLGGGGQAAAEGEAAARRISEAAEEGTAVDLAAVVPGDWTRVLVAPPYTPDGEIERLAAVDAGPVIASNIAARDDVTVVAFLGGERPVVAEIPQTLPVIWGRARVLSRAAAVFPVSRGKP